MTHRPLLATLLLLLTFGIAFAQKPAADQNLYVVTYIDIIPTPAGLGAMNNLLKQEATDSHKDPGCIRYDVVQQDGRLNHYTILALWRSRADFEAHTAAVHTRAFRTKLQSAMGSPYDERLNFLLQ